MPDDGRQIVKVTNQELQEMRFDDALEIWSPNLATALPDHIPLDRFRRVVITAVNQNAKLARADRRSLFNACAKCAHDGLYPDGREAALVPYSTKVTRNGQDYWVDMVQYLPMIAGIRKRMRNTGEVLAATAEVVYRNDHFRYVKGEDPHIEHEPCALDQEKGEMIGAYAIIKLANGEVLRETMPAKDIDRIMRTFAKGYDKSGSPWQTSRDEMWRKTVMRRCSKSAPTGSELDRIFARDEEQDHPRADSPLREIPPRPRPEDYLQIENGEAGGEEETQAEREDIRFEVVDFDGQITEYATAESATATLLTMIQKAPTLKALEGRWEDNIEVIAEIDESFEKAGRESVLSGAYAAARKAFEGGQANGQDRPQADQAPESAGTPGQTDAPKPAAHAPRDEKFWSQKKFVLPETAKPKEFLYYTQQYLRQCRDQFDVNGIETDNADRFKKELSENDRKEAEAMIDRRRKELPA